MNQKKTHCPAGHPYNKNNTYFFNGPYGIKRQCRACSRSRMAFLRAKHDPLKLLRFKLNYPDYSKTSK